MGYRFIFWGWHVSVFRDQRRWWRTRKEAGTNLSVLDLVLIYTTDRQIDVRHASLLIASTLWGERHRLNNDRDRALFHSKTCFWPSYCQTSTDLVIWINFTHTYCCTEYTCGPIYTAIGTWTAPGQTKTTMFYIIIETHHKSYIETTDRRDFGGKPSKWRWGRTIVKKIPEFSSVGGVRSKTAFCVFRVPSTILCTACRKQLHPRSMIPLESRDSGGVPFNFASLESLWPGIWQI